MGRRFETTTRSAQEASALKKAENDFPVEKLERLDNTKTSIVFGSDEAPQWPTRYNKKSKPVAVVAGERAHVDTGMKKALTATHFVLGKETLDYCVESTRPDPTGNMAAYTATSAGSDPRISSLYFGGDKVSYATTSSDALRPVEERPARPVRLKSELTRHSFTFGKEESDYSTTHRGSFTYDKESAQGARGLLVQEKMKDLRREHFSLKESAEDNFETNAQRSAIAEVGGAEHLAQMKENARAARTLKQKLLATNVIVGDDPDYMS